MPSARPVAKLMPADIKAGGHQGRQEQAEE
jgi:hypothetical protein